MTWEDAWMITCQIRRLFGSQRPFGHGQRRGLSYP